MSDLVGNLKDRYSHDHASTVVCPVTVPVRRAITLSPCFHFCEQPGPSFSTVPAASNPKISLSPGGGGYNPFLLKNIGSLHQEGKGKNLKSITCIQVTKKNLNKN